MARISCIASENADEVGGHPKSFERIKYHEKLAEFLHSKCTAHRDISREEKVGSDDPILT